MLNMGGAWNGYNVFALGYNPGQCQLAGTALLFIGNLPYSIYQFQVFIEVITLETRVVPAEVVFRNVAGVFKAAGQKAASQRAVGHKTNAQFPGGIEDFLFRISCPERVFSL